LIVAMQPQRFTRVAYDLLRSKLNGRDHSAEIAMLAGLPA
jgi:hypothetical protein